MTTKLLIAINIIFTFYGPSLAFEQSFYTYTQNIFPDKYDIFWSTSSTQLFFALAVSNHTGWVAFGIAEQTSGSMPGSDIVALEWDDDSKLTATDMFALGKYRPLVDDCNNWQLVSYETSPTGILFIELVRDLDTKDPQDRAIITGYQRVTASFGNSQKISYHGPNRIATTVNFIQANKTEPIIKGNITIQMRQNSSLPTQVTTYMCQAFKMPSDKNYHIVKFIPYIQPDNHHVVHHFLLHVCEFVNNSQNVVRNYSRSTSGECNSPLGDLGGGCTSITYAWAVGQTEYYVPEEAGFPVGPDPNSIHYIVLEIHYNNPELIPGIQDHSGVDIVLTDELRQYDAGVMSFGDVLANGNPIPPNQTDYPYESDCPSECTSLWPHEIHIFASFLHMHSHGSAMYTTITKNGSSPEFTNRIEFWDYDFQQQTPIQITVKPGDQLNTVCLYNTESETKNVTFGISSSQEMCMDFVSYYPRIFAKSGFAYAFCGSVGFQAQFANGSYTIVSRQKSTLCGSVAEWGSMLYPDGKTVINPIHPLPNLKDFDVRHFGSGSYCGENPPNIFWTDMMILGVSGGVLLVAIVIIIIIVVAVKNNARRGYNRLTQV